MKKTWILIGFLIIAIILLLVLNLTTKRGPTQEARKPSPASVTTVLPQLPIEYSNPAVSVDRQLSAKPFPKSLPIYKAVAINVDHDKKAKEIASLFGIEDQYEGVHTQTKLRKSSTGSEDLYTWIDNGKILVYRLKNDTFEYSSEFKSVTGQENGQGALDKSISFLKSNGGLLPENYKTNVEYLKLPALAISDKNDFSVYRVSVIPQIEDIPLISYKNNGQIISFLLNKDLTFLKVDYLFIPPQKTGQLVNLKTADTIISEVSNLRAKPTFLEFSNLPPEINIDELKITGLNIKDIQLGYYFNPRDNGDQIFPAYRITADVETPEGLSGTATYLEKAY